MLRHLMLRVRHIHPAAAESWLSPQSLGPYNTGAVLKVKMSETQTPPKADLGSFQPGDSGQIKSSPSSWNCLSFFPNICHFCGHKSLFTSVNSLGLVMTSPTRSLMNSSNPHCHQNLFTLENAYNGFICLRVPFLWSTWQGFSFLILFF